jgi:hypothetical protein
MRFVLSFPCAGTERIRTFGFRLLLMQGPLTNFNSYQRLSTDFLSPLAVLREGGPEKRRSYAPADSQPLG